MAKNDPSFQGVGHIQFAGHAGPAQYAITGDPRRRSAGATRLRGSITVDPELALLAFRAGEGLLTLEGGEALRVVMLAHSSGGAEVFIEIKS